jgi:hypothetical protein
LPGETEENYKKPQSRKLVSMPRFKYRTSDIHLKQLELYFELKTNAYAHHMIPNCERTTSMSNGLFLERK